MNRIIEFMKQGPRRGGRSGTRTIDVRMPIRAEEGPLNPIPIVLSQRTQIMKASAIP
jgi:hypothetical protein